MKIAFITDVIDKNMSGVGIYSKALVQSIINTYPNHEYFFIDYRPQVKKFFKYKKTPQAIIIKKNNVLFNKKSLWLNYIALKLRKYSLDFVFNLDGTPHYLPFNQKEVFILHDLSHLKNFYFSPLLRQLNNQMFLYRSLSQSYKVVTNSHKTKNEAIDSLKIKKDKLITIKNLPFFSPMKSQKYLIAKKPFFLSIGNLEKRKNIVNLLEAYATLRKQHEINQKLIIVGKAAFGSQEIMQIYNKSRYKKDIIFTKYIDDQKKYYLLKNADLFIYPSEFEGLGIPLLEAAFLRCPIIASDVPSGVEILKRNYFVLTHYDKDSIVSVIIKALNNENMRKTFIREAYLRVTEYLNAKNFHEEIKRLFSFLIE